MPSRSESPDGSEDGITRGRGDSSDAEEEEAEEERAGSEEYPWGGGDEDEGESEEPSPSPQPTITPYDAAAGNTAGSAAAAEELRSLRLQVSSLRGRAARADILFEEKREAALLIRQLEAQVQAKTREATTLSAALAAAYVAANERAHMRQQHRHPATARLPASHRTAPKRNEQGYELVQVLLEGAERTAPRHYTQPVAWNEMDPLAVLDGQRDAAQAPSPQGHQLIIRMRDRVYALRELNRAKPSMVQLTQRIDNFMSTAPTSRPSMVQPTQRSVPPPQTQPPPQLEPQAHSYAQPPPAPHRQAPRPYSAGQRATRAVGDANASLEPGGSGPTVPPNRYPGKPSRPASAQAALRGSAASASRAVPSGIDPTGRSVLAGAAAGLFQQANRAQFISPYGI